MLNKIGSICFLRIFATVIIVVSHAWSTLPKNPEMFFLSSSEQVFLEIAYSLTKWGVPIFFCITGALLLKKDKIITINDCICKYSKRMLLALFIFGVPFALFIIFFETRLICFSMFYDAFLRIIYGKSFSHLWYLYTLIGIYLFLPVIKLFVNNASKQVLEYILYLLFIFNFCIPFINYLFGVEIAFKLPLTTFPLFYLLLGHYVYNVCFNWENKRVIAFLGILFSSMIIIAIRINEIPLIQAVSYSSPIIAIFAFCILVLFRCIRKECTNTTWEIDRLCFGVYLIHPVFIHLVYKFFHILPVGNNYYQLLSVLFAIGFVFISFIASLGLYKIKLLKKYVL